MAEKVAMRLLAKDLYVQVCSINDALQRKVVQQEVLLSNTSHM